MKVAPRTLRGLAALALGVALASVLGSGRSPGRAHAADCVWQRHTKKVVVHVKRHGRRTRVVRHRHFWTCEPSSLSGTGSGAAGGTDPLAANRLSVHASEYTYVLSRPDVSSGSVTVELDNRGQDPHDLNLAPEGSSDPPRQIPLTGAGQRATTSFDLAPGTYRLWCDLPGHDGLGMHATLIVDP
jgi:plastocyanin